MHNMPKVSVIIPAYNRAYIINEAIKSILSQTFTDFEVLIIDDGSSDTTQQVVRLVEDTRVKYFHKENGGVSSARNMGIANAAGEYIAFLDTDDLWPKNFIEVLMTKLQENKNYGLAYCPTTETSPDGTMIRKQDTARCVSGHITKELFKNSFIWPMAVLIRKNILQNFCFDESLKTSDDNDAFLRLSVKAPFVFVPDIDVTRRTCPDSHARHSTVKNACNRARSLERFYFHLGGDSFIPAKLARKKISRVYKRAARRNATVKNRTAAISLFKRAIKYSFMDVSLYAGLLRAFLISKKEDALPDWKMPGPLKII
jgi:glycosyltransferase involved in cell wall biosynthesis